jgi:hypothetical protein
MEEDFDDYEREAELALYREYRDVAGQFKYVVETERRFYLANEVTLERKDTETDFYFEIVMTDVWVWDIYRSDRFVKNVRVMTFKDVNVEELSLKEFELRVIFQMSGADSSQLIDSPAAVKLGPQRALFIHEETGTLEKFRPYAFPSGEWLAGVSAAMQARPQGNPGERRVAAPTAPSAKSTPPRAAPGDDFGFTGKLGGGFGDDEFNFAKFLDDPPAEGSPPEEAKP